MASLEYRILTKILKEGSLHPALVAGLKEEHFQDIEAKQIWRFFNQHWYNQETFRTVPTLGSIQRKWPSFQLTGEGRDALTALISDLRTSTLDLNARRIATEFQDLVDVDTSCDAIRKMRDKINALLSEAERSEEYGLKDIVKHATEHYAGAKNGAVYGIPWPWDCLTHDTLGKRKGNLIVFYARMKSMKCVCEGQRIMMPSGELIPIEKLPEVTEVPSYTKRTGRVRYAKARRVVSGIKSCVEVNTTRGLCLRTSVDHLYMVPSGGYQRIRDLKVGSLLVVSRRFAGEGAKFPEIEVDSIKSITPIGDVPCYDICIEDGMDPNFIVEGFVVHNTWVMLYSAVYDYMVNNCRVLVWSREMSKEDICLRIASILAKVDYQLFKKGRLPPKKEKEAFEILNALLTQEEDLDSRKMKEAASKGARHLLIMAGRGAPRDTESLQIAIDKYQPGVVYLDSFYHLDPSNASKKSQRWERLATLSENIKAMGQDNGIPIIAVHQANRLGEKTYGNTLTDLADSDVLARESDLIIRILKRRGRELYEEDYEVARDNPEPAPRVFKKKGPEIAKEASNNPTETEDDAPRVGAELALVLGGNREGILEAFTINAVPGYNFSLISSDYSTQEISQWLKEDEEHKPVKSAPRPDEVEKFNKNSFRQYLKGN